MRISENPLLNMVRISQGENPQRNGPPKERFSLSLDPSQMLPKIKLFWGFSISTSPIMRIARNPALNLMRNNPPRERFSPSLDPSQILSKINLFWRSLISTSPSYKNLRKSPSKFDKNKNVSLRNLNQG